METNTHPGWIDTLRRSPREHLVESERNALDRANSYQEAVVPKDTENQD